MKTVIWPHKMWSSGSRELADYLDIWRVYPNRKYRPGPKDVVINWGNSGYPKWWRQGLKVLNHPEKVRNAIDKVKCFQLLENAGVPTPQWSTIHPNVGEKDIWLARTLTRANEGRGIVLFKSGDPIPNAGLYTKHLRHKHEYRVHVIAGETIDVQQKRRRKGVEVDTLIRSWNNGWVFCRDNVEAPACVMDVAQKAVLALGLDFGAVDVAYREKENKAYVLEVNTAPGLEGETIEAYAEGIRNAL